MCFRYRPFCRQAAVLGLAVLVNLFPLLPAFAQFSVQGDVSSPEGARISINTRTKLGEIKVAAQMWMGPKIDPAKPVNIVMLMVGQNNSARDYHWRIWATPILDKNVNAVLITPITGQTSEAFSEPSVAWPLDTGNPKGPANAKHIVLLQALMQLIYRDPHIVLVGYSNGGTVTTASLFQTNNLGFAPACGVLLLASGESSVLGAGRSLSTNDMNLIQGSAPISILSCATPDDPYFPRRDIEKTYSDLRAFTKMEVNYRAPLSYSVCAADPHGAPVWGTMESRNIINSMLQECSIKVP